jgi:O-antigen ligase
MGLVATAGPSVAYVNTVLTPSLRWIVLLLLAGSLILSNHLFVGLRGYTKIFMLSLLALATLSTFWSPVPQLSGFKSLAFLLVVVAYSSAGALWLRSSARKNVLNVFWPLVILALVAGFGGIAGSGAQVQMNEAVTLHRGLTYNSNFLGMLVLAVLPLPLWRISQPRISRNERWFYYILLAILLYLQVTTFARASFLGAAVIVVFFFMGRGMGRLALILLLIATILMIVPSLFPALAAEIVEKYIYKGSGVNGSILASRSFVWSASYEGAVQGSLWGLGYGVSYGFDNYALGFEASGYGREKANVFLAIVEENGIFGLVLFLGMLLSLVLRGFVAIQGAFDRKDRLLMFLIIGYILALTVHAQFEAWMFSPGGALTPAFWTAIGMLTQLSYEVLGARSTKSIRSYPSSFGQSTLPETRFIGVRHNV